MFDSESTPTPESTTRPTSPAATSGDQAPAKKAAAKKTVKKAAAKKTTKKAVTKKSATSATAEPAPAEPATAAKRTAKRAPRKSTKKAAAPVEASADVAGDMPAAAADGAPDVAPDTTTDTTAPGAVSPLFQPPDPGKAVTPKRDTATAKKKQPKKKAESPARTEAETRPDAGEQPDRSPEQDSDQSDDEREGGTRRRRRRGGRRRRKSTSTEGEESAEAPSAEQQESAPPTSDQPDPDEETGTGTRRRRRRRRSGEAPDSSTDDPENTVVRVREPRPKADDRISSVSGSTRLEAKKQRRREGREAGRRRPPLVSEAEFLARRESVERLMVVRQREDLTQIAVLEDKVLVEHYVARETQASMIGNVYLGRVQNVLPSMEAAFIDIGKGRNAILYAGEVNWDALGKEGQPRRIEAALKSGQTVLVQVTKDPVGHKGARLTSQISLPGRYLVYLPDGQTSGISRKLPDVERNRLKSLLKDILPEAAGVIIRTAAEGASEEELRRDAARLTARWDDIAAKVAGGQAPQLLYGEPDLLLKVVRDLFTEDFTQLVVSGDDAWESLETYVGHVAPDLMPRVERWSEDDGDVFASYRIDEQIAKGLDRKVFLPSGGSLVIDRTEAMTVVDVNTGKFTGSGGNLEETVTKNNLEAAEEIVRQLRLRDIGGIIVVDFIDMVLESNRELVLRRLIECLGRDRTKHQVAEVTSLGLVQMTRKRIGTGLLEAFSEVCEQCQGRGLLLHEDPVEPQQRGKDQDRYDDRRGRRSRRRGSDNGEPKPKPEFPAALRPTSPTTETETESTGSEPAATGAESAPGPEVVEQPALTELPAPVQQPEPTEQPEAQPSAGSPRRTRRRAVSRPAGPAGADLSTAEPAT